MNSEVFSMLTDRLPVEIACMIDDEYVKLCRADHKKKFATALHQIREWVLMDWVNDDYVFRSAQQDGWITYNQAKYHKFNFRKIPNRRIPCREQYCWIYENNWEFYRNSGGQNPCTPEVEWWNYTGKCPEVSQCSKCKQVRRKKDQIAKDNVIIGAVLGGVLLGGYIWAVRKLLD
jgi:hypothetical protein